MPKAYAVGMRYAHTVLYSQEFRSPGCSKVFWGILEYSSVGCSKVFREYS